MRLNLCYFQWWSFYKISAYLDSCSYFAWCVALHLINQLKFLCLDLCRLFCKVWIMSSNRSINRRLSLKVFKLDNWVFLLLYYFCQHWLRRAKYILPKNCRLLRMNPEHLNHHHHLNHTTDTDFEVTKFSLFTFYWACTEVTSCLGIAMCKVSTCVLLFKYMYLKRQTWTWAEC